MKIINAKNVKLSAAEETTLEQINDNPKFFIENTITVIAKKYHCSESTISRLAQKLGFGNIKFFQMFISERFNFANNYYKVRDELTLEDIIHNIRTYKMYSIHESFSELDFNMLNLLIEKIDTAKKICLFGVSSNYNPACVLNDNFNCIGLNSYCCNAYNNLILNLQNLTKNGLLIIFSDSNQTKPLKPAISQLANQLQVRVALISTDKELIMI